MKRFLMLMASSLPFFAFAQFKLPEVKAPVFKKDTVNILNFGAVGDGITLNSTSFNSAIEAQSKKGGGVVLVPAGYWYTGPIVLKNNINLHLASGAFILFSKDKEQYPLVKANWEGQPQMRCQSPISAEDQTNIAITGKGTIDANGDVWRAVKKEKLNETQWKALLNTGGLLSEDKKTWFPSEKYAKGNAIKEPGLLKPERDIAFYDSVKDFFRPNMVVFTNCKKVLLEGVTFQNSPAWCLHPLLCEDLIVRNVTVKNPWYAQNGDGIDVESCKNILIEGTVFDVGDDGLCMKSGRDAEGRKRGRPTENVTIRHCTVYAAHGGFVIGSEMSGGCRNINVTKCSFIGTDIGLRFKTTRGRGGVVENIYVNNIWMKNIVGEAILFDMYYMAKDPIPLAGEKRELPQVEFKQIDETTPVFRNFQISNVYCNGAAKAIFIRGLPEMHVKDIQLQDLVLQANKGVDIQEASNISLKNVRILCTNTSPVADITQSDNIRFDHFGYTNDSYLLFRISGDRSREINVMNTNMGMTKQKVQFDLGATEKALIIK